MTPGRYKGWEIALIVLAAMSPFWFLASRIDDLDELVKSGAGAAIAAVLGLIFRFVSGKGGDEK